MFKLRRRPVDDVLDSETRRKVENRMRIKENRPGMNKNATVHFLSISSKC